MGGLSRLGLDLSINFGDHNGRICTSPCTAVIYARANNGPKGCYRDLFVMYYGVGLPPIRSFSLLRIRLRRRQLIGKLSVGLTEQGGRFWYREPAD